MSLFAHKILFYKKDEKYFYQHKPLRSMEEVSAEILALEKENEGLIMDFLKMSESGFTRFKDERYYKIQKILKSRKS